MGLVKILYCPNGEPTIPSLIYRSVDDINTQPGIFVELTYVPDYNGFCEKLSNGIYFDFAILKLPQNGAGICDHRQHIGHKFRGALVAESARHPFNTREVLQHFDAYIGPIFHSKNLEALLRQYSHLPQASK